MVPLLFALLIAVPLAELYIIVQVAGGIGFIETVLLLIAISIAGAWLLKQQGLQTWRRLQDALASGQMPHREVVDGVLILVGGALLLTPGFLTDAVGLLFLAPPSRAGLKRGARRVFARWARRRVAPGLRIYETTARARRRTSTPEARPDEDAIRSRSTRRPEDSPPVLPPEHRPGEDDFPDRA